MKYSQRRLGLLRQMYSNMYTRIRSHHGYRGLPILNRLDFYDWAIAQSSYHQLYDEWQRNDYLFALTPSINRKDSSKGYLIANMEFLTLHENRLEGLINGRPKVTYLNGEQHHWNKYPDSVLLEIKQARKEGRSFQSIANEWGVSKTHVSRVCKTGDSWATCH